MNSQSEKMSPTSDRPSFFGLPRRWTQAGLKFFGGLVCGICVGIGFGLLIGAELVEQGAITPDSKGRVVVTALVLQVIGIWFASWAVRRSKQR